MFKARLKENRKRLFALAVIVVLLFALIAPATTAYASTLYEYDCPYCSDGVITTQLTEECTYSGCDDGSVLMVTSSVCSTCAGSGYGSAFCSTCGGYGYVVNDIVHFDTFFGYELLGCTSCGGSGNDSATTYGELDFSEIVAGCGKAACSYCTGGIIYTTTTQDCPACLGVGFVTSTVETTCEWCEGDGSFVCGIENISTIATQIITAGETQAVSFTFEEVGTVGDIEYYWYIDGDLSAITSEPSMTLKLTTAGTYKVYCKIVPAVGYAYETETFTVYVLGSVSDGSETNTDTDTSTNSETSIYYARNMLIFLGGIIVVGVVIYKRGKG